MVSEHDFKNHNSRYRNAAFIEAHYIEFEIQILLGS